MLQSNHKLKPYERHVPAFLAKWAARRRTGSGWRSAAGRTREWLKVTYAEAKRQVDAVTQALLDRGFGPDKPVMILSSNSIEFALLTMAAMQARAPLAPVSPAYSVMSQDHAKLRYVFDLIKPGMVFVQNGEIYAPGAGGARSRRRAAGACRQGAAADAVAAVERAGGDEADRRRGEFDRADRAPGPWANSCSPRAAPACPRR